MSEKVNEFQAAVTLTQTDRHYEVILAVEEANDILAMINRERLNEREMREYRAIKRDLTSVLLEFQSTYPSAHARASARTQMLNHLNHLRRILQVLLLGVAIFVLFESWQEGLALLLCVATLRVVSMEYLLSQCRAAVRLGTAPVERILTAVGHPEDGARAASGLCARADELYLATLDHTMLAMERRQRQSMREEARARLHRKVAGAPGSSYC
ncbi:hypothetical protein VR010_11775 [Actinomycetaceae bacterium L2_0104]